MSGDYIMATQVEPVLRITNLSKSFAGKRVLNEVTFSVAGGEVVGLLGQNGSGKSTLIKMVSRFYEADPGGSIHVNGSELQSMGSSAGRAMAFVHQNLGLFNTLPVLDNLMVNRWTQAGGQIPWRELRREARALLEEFEIDVELETLVGSLSSGDRAAIAIARAVADLRNVDRGLLVLDEPTPYLARDEVRRLFSAIRAAAARGIGILFVSHRLDEILEVTDRVVVLRDGRVVGDDRTLDVSESELITMIVGRSLTEFYPSVSPSSSEVILRVRDLAHPLGGTVNLEISRGEIFGVTGLLGSGFEDIPYILAGAKPVASGSAEIEGTEVDLARLTPSQAIRVGMVLVPADRSREGVSATMTVRENISLPWIDNLTNWFGIDKRHEQSQVDELIRRFDVRPSESESLMGTLSGGNQQKTVLARWIAQNPKVLLLHEPTQGVDVGARQQIFQLIRDAVAGGMSVIYASLEYEDLAHMCDRVLVFRDGAVVAELTGADVSAGRMTEVSMRNVSV